MPAISPGGTGSVDDVWLSRRGRRATSASPSSGSSEQLEKTMRPPGLTSATARSSSRRCSSASLAMSAGDFVQGTSGWRRTVPVEEQGASSSTASNSSCRLVCRAYRPATISASRPSRSRLLAEPRQPVLRDVDRGDVGAGQRRAAPSCRRARRKDRRRACPATSPSSRAGRLAAASCTHHAPRQSRAARRPRRRAARRAPSRSAARCRRASRPSAPGRT